MGDLGLPVTLEGVLVGLLGEVERVEESHGGEGTGHVVDGERVDARGDASGLGRGEGGGGADEGDGGGLEHDEEIDGVELTRQLKLCEDSVEREARIALRRQRGGVHRRRGRRRRKAFCFPSCVERGLPGTFC